MAQIKGPAIFLAQFMGDEEPFNSLSAITKWAKSLGYLAVQIRQNTAQVKQNILAQNPPPPQVGQGKPAQLRRGQCAIRSTRWPAVFSSSAEAITLKGKMVSPSPRNRALTLRATRLKTLPRK